MTTDEELRKEIIQKIVISLLNDINYQSKKVFCENHAREKATIIENSIRKHSTEYTSYTEPAVINYLTSTILAKTKECKIH